MKYKYTNKDVINYKNIAMVIRSNDKKKKMSRLDYYLLGGIHFRDASAVVYHIHADNMITTNEYYALNTYITEQRIVDVLYDKQAVLATKFIFDGKTITDIEKEAVWNALINYGIPEKNIDDMVFSAAVRAYAIKKGYVKIINNGDSNTKTLKKQ